MTNDGMAGRRAIEAVSRVRGQGLHGVCPGRDSYQDEKEGDDERLDGAAMLPQAVNPLLPLVY
jgi:hypothetical protein